MQSYKYFQNQFPDSYCSPLKLLFFLCFLNFYKYSEYFFYYTVLNYQKQQKYFSISVIFVLIEQFFHPYTFIHIW